MRVLPPRAVQGGQRLVRPAGSLDPVLSAIAAKLMAKSAEDRYQSSYGLIAASPTNTVRQSGP